MIAIPNGQHRQETRAVWKVAAFIGLALAAHLLGIVLSGGIATFVPRIQPPLVFPLVTGLLLLPGSWVCLRVLDRKPLAAMGIGLDRPWLVHTMLGLLVGVGLQGLLLAVFLAAGLASTRLNEDFSGLGVPLLAGLILSIGIAVLEGLLYRGYAFQVLARWNPLAAVLLTGLVYVAVHLPSAAAVSPLSMVNLFLLHLLLVACYLRTRSLWLPIALHAAWGFARPFLFGMITGDQARRFSVFVTELNPNRWTGHGSGPDAGPIVTLLLAVAVAAVAILLKQRHRAPDLLASRAAGAATEIPPSPEPAVSGERIAPVGPAARIGAIDVLRGAAILGILPMNMQLFAMIDGAFLNPYAGLWTDKLDVVVWTFLRIFIGHKDLTVFSMLFGAGILMVEAKCRRSGQDAARLHVRRMLILLSIGLAHAYLIWSGDILFTYALCGLLVYLFRNARPSALIWLGACAYAVPMFLLLIVQLSLGHLNEETAAAVYAQFQPTPEMIAEHHAVYRGGWLAQMPHRAETAFGLQTVLLVTALGWVAGGMMLVGMGLHKLEVFTARLRDRIYWYMIAGAAFVGLPLILFGLWRNFALNFRPEQAFFGGRIPSECAAPIMAVGWIGVIMLVCKHRLIGSLTGPLAAVGRMALTNYLAQSVICSLIFYGHGLGLVGRISRFEQLLIAVTIWVVQLICSSLWLKRYRFGPVEWLWRRLSYSRPEPMRTGGRPIAAT